MDTANGLAHFIIGRRGDGAGIQNDEIGVGKGGGRDEAAAGQTGFQRRAVGLRSTAAEGFDQKSLHSAQ
jgi:hypothetical protein